jgi:hypothetical protein
MSDATFTDGDLAVVRGLIKHWNEWGAPEYGKVRTTLRYATGEIEETYCELAIALNKLLAEREAQVRAEEREKVKGLEKDSERLKYLISDPSGARHLLHLLELGKGDSQAFISMVDRLISSKLATYNDNRKG